MKKSEKRQQLLRAIQEYMAQEGMTPSDLYRCVLERGGGVSDTTIRRIAKAEADKENFSLEVLQTVTNALFGITDKPIPAEDISSPEVAEREALKAVSVLTDVALQEAQAKIAQLEVQLAEADRKILQLTEIAEFRKQQMIDKDRQIERLWAMVEKNEV